ncbi:MAG: hypothetical protein J1E32_08730, partial [Treponema sp.]|nr:hypothetical protein [Treponema sp.]
LLHPVQRGRNCEDRRGTLDEDSRLFRDADEATTLEFHLPQILETGSRYIIAIHTKMSGTYELKIAVTGYSKIIVMIAV